MSVPSFENEPIEVSQGQPFPLGPSLTQTGCNFAVRAPHAELVAICFYDEQEHEAACFPLPHRSGEIWHGHFTNIRAGSYYGFRAKGEFEPAKGLYFDANKLLIDPYAKAVSRPLNWEQTLYAGDSKEMVPKSRVVKPELFDWQGVEKPNIPQHQTILYEAHVRGFTLQHPKLPQKVRGTFLAMAHPTIINYLLELGVTTVQLMPVNLFMPEPWLVERGLTNYWGYNPVNFFAPEPRYACEDAYTEFKVMVRELHKAGLEVILDVVFNHTAEGGGDGPVLSLRGLDNRSTYWFAHHEGEPDHNHYINHSGCGNAVNLHHPDTLTLVLDALRYWVEEMQVDGFRFDLAVTLAREPFGFQQQGAFLKAVYQDPILRHVKLIAEPWDVGLGGYQLGQFPVNWAECNDRYRDTMRSFWRGDSGYLSDFATRLMGSRDIFHGHHRTPHSSVNFITYHDGFTLHDLVTYEHRHNEANLEESRDGHAHNISANYGVEGETRNKLINNLRKRQQRNMLATLFLSRGIPHLLCGDEVSRTQQGNNNAYCQDSPISWHNWNLTKPQQELLKFVKRLIDLRKSSAVLNQYCVQDDPFYLGNGRVSVDWLAPSGKLMTGENWHNPSMQCVAVFLQPPQSETGKPMLLIFNAAEQACYFHLPKHHRWQLLLNSHEKDGGGQARIRSARYKVQGRTTAVMAGDPKS